MIGWYSNRMYRLESFINVDGQKHTGICFLKSPTLPTVAFPFLSILSSRRCAAWRTAGINSVALDAGNEEGSLFSSTGEPPVNASLIQPVA